VLLLRVIFPAWMGHLQMVRGSISGIPYCDIHRDKMSLKVGSDKKLLLCWGSLRMMRRYFELKSTGLLSGLGKIPSAHGRAVWTR
jgi:hypothetical protein